MSTSFRSKKILGQYFLTNTDILKKIAAAAEIRHGDLEIEIGPGTGTLTDELLKTGAYIIAIEKDRELAVLLCAKYKNTKNIEIIENDILKFDPSFVIRHSSFVIVGNIPYYLTSRLLRIILTQWPPPKLIVLMVQKEVAQRIIARSPHMNMLALLVQLHGTPEIVRIVKRGSFSPPPKVDSAILKIAVKLYSSTAVKLLQLAARGFAHPRKMLGSNLPKDKLIKAGIDPARRPGTLTVDEWRRISME